MPGANDPIVATVTPPGAAPPEAGNKGEVTPPAKAGEGTPPGDSGEVDLTKLDPKVQKLIKDLRTESAGHRTKNKELSDSTGKLKKALVEAGIIEDDSGSPEEQLKALSAAKGSLEFTNAILESAIEHGVAKDGLEYYSFLVQKRANELGENEELTPEILAELAGKVKKQVVAPAASTSVGGGNATPPSPGGSDAVTLDRFVRMSMGEKADLYNKNAALYTQLMTEAREKKLLVK